MRRTGFSAESRTGFAPRTTPIPRTAGLVRAPCSRTVPLLSGSGGKTRSAPRTKARAESFPPAVAALIDARDPWCVKCGSPYDLHRHHRRIKGIGGDGRDHTDCACNGVKLCRSCHLDWAHSGDGRREAKDEGVVIPRAESEPWRQPLMVHTAADSGMTIYLTCDGRYVTEPQELAA